MDLRGEHEELKDAYTNLSRDTTQVIESQKANIATLTSQLSLLQAELKDAQTIADQRHQALEDLQHQFDDVSVSQDVSRAALNDDESWTVVKEELHRQTSYLRTVEAENAKMTTELAILRQRQSNAEVLKEQKRELERRVRDTDVLQEQVVKLEAELAAALRERDELYALFC